MIELNLHAIRAGGFSIVARSLKDAKSSHNNPKFYLDTVEETLTTRTELTKLKIKLYQHYKLYMILILQS